MYCTQAMISTTIASTFIPTMMELTIADCRVPMISNVVQASVISTAGRSIQRPVATTCRPSPALKGAPESTAGRGRPKSASDAVA